MRKQDEATETRERSSRKLRISTGLPSASCQGVESSCQVSLASLASKRMKEERGRLCGCGVTRPWRLRMRQMVVTEGGWPRLRLRW